MGVVVCGLHGGFLNQESNRPKCVIAMVSSMHAFRVHFVRLVHSAPNDQALGYYFDCFAHAALHIHHALAIKSSMGMQVLFAHSIST